MMINYLQVLEESLKSKLRVLEKIEVINKEQEKILLNQDMDFDTFDSSLDEKGVLIDELNHLDHGFQNIYENIKEQLASKKSLYSNQIAAMKKLIAQVTDKSVVIQAQESRNKKLVEAYFANAKKEVKQGRLNSRAAMDYYKNMSKSSLSNSQYMDEKK